MGGGASFSSEALVDVATSILYCSLLSLPARDRVRDRVRVSILTAVSLPAGWRETPPLTRSMPPPVPTSSVTPGRMWMLVRVRAGVRVRVRVSDAGPHVDAG